MSKSKRFFKQLTFLSFFLLNVFLVNDSSAATYFFNTLYKGTGSTYDQNTNSITGLVAMNGTSFKFYQSGAQFSGNSVNGTLSYYDVSNNLVSINGQLNRRDKSGTTSYSFYFVPFNAGGTTFTGSAYLLVVPGYENLYSAGGVATTSSDPIGSALNAQLATLPQISTITLSSSSVVEGQNLVYTVTLSAAPASGNPQKFTYNTSGTAYKANDYNSTYSFSNGVIDNADGTITVPAGVSSFSITVATIDDSNIESIENLVLTIGSKSALGSIKDNDVPTAPQCEVNNPYDKIVSGFHQSIALKTDASFAVWGQDLTNSGTGNVLVPVEINASNYPKLVGTPLKATIGGAGGTSTEQAILLTSDGLYAWGNEGGVIDIALTSSSTFDKIVANQFTTGNASASTGLPIGVNPYDVKMMTASYNTLIILTNTGDVWTLSSLSGNLNANGSSSTASKTWFKAKTNATTYLSDITAVRVQASTSALNAVIALKSDGTVYTWGSSTYLGDGSAAAVLNYATQMTLPTEFSITNIPKMIAVTGGNKNDGNTKNSFYILSNSGALYSLGYNAQRQLGDFSTTERKSWVNAKMDGTTNFSNVTFITAQEHDAYFPGVAAVTKNGDLFTWGENEGLALGRTTNGQIYDPGTPLGFTPGSDIALSAELGGHTLVYIKQGTTKFCYVGHKTSGSMGDGDPDTNGSFINTFDCDNTPSLSICGSVPNTASLITSVISANPTSIIANGTSTSVLTVQLKESNGTNLSSTGGTVEIFTDKGSVSQVTDNNDGTYTAILTSSTNVETANLTYTLNGNAGTNTATVNFIAAVSPTITITGSVNPFITCAGTASAAQSFSVTASNLTADLTITTPAGFQIATTQIGTYTNTIIINPSSGTISATSIWVSMSGETAGTFSGTITATSTGASTQSVTVSGTVSPASVGGTIAGSASVCTGTNSTVLTLSGNTGTITKWQSATTANFSGTVTDIVNTTTSLTATNLTATTYYRAVVQSGSCTAANSGTASVTVSPASVGGTIAGSASVCKGTNSTLLTLSDHLGNIVKWQSSTLSDFSASVVDIVNNTTSYTATDLSATTYFRAIVLNGACSAVNSDVATLTSIVCTKLNPDFNTTYVKVPVTGNVSTNDIIRAGTTYGTTVPSSLNPSVSTITLNVNGTYTFTSLVAGKYVYYVPVCEPSQTTNCATVMLEITVIDPLSNTNLPIAKNDFATTQKNIALEVNVLANDKVANMGTQLNPASVVVTVDPKNGTATVNTTSGAVTYTPVTGFIGTDSLTYKVCDNSNPVLCQTAIVYLSVTTTAAPNTTVAVDDFVKTPYGSNATGTILTNDYNTGAAEITVTAYESISASKGVIVINADGTYTFTPASGFSGPVDVTYTICTNESPAVCAIATLHISVDPPIVLKPDINATNVNVPVKGNVNTNDVKPLGTTYGTPLPSANNPAGGSITMNANGSYVFTTPSIGKYRFDVPVCGFGQTTGCPLTPLEITVVDPNILTNPPIVNNDYATTSINSAVEVKVLSNDRVSNIGTALVPSTIVVTVSPKNGTASINTTTGIITYIPTTGYAGEDSLTYKVSDNSATPLSAKANVYITTTDYVTHANAISEETIPDNDFNNIYVNTPATGNVLSNDINTSGNTLTVTNYSTPLSTEGVILINEDGSYVFTPAKNFSGTVDVIYTACAGSVCGTATLHILVTPQKPAPPKPIHGTFTTGVATNPATIASTVTDIPAGCKVIYCDVNGTNCSTNAPALPTVPGIYVWCIKSLDTITNLTSDPCVYDTLRILPVVKTINATYVNGVTTNPANIRTLVTSITAGSNPKWCDVNGNNCTTTAPVLPTKSGTYIWCVKAVDIASGLTSANCVMDTVTILDPYTVMEISKTARAVKLNPDGTVLITFAMSASNKTDADITNVSIVDDLSKTFNTTMGITVYSLETYGGLVKNTAYNGISNIDLVTSSSRIEPKKSDSLVLKVLVSGASLSGKFLNTSVLSATTKYGNVSVSSNDPSINANDTTTRTPTPFIIPQIDIIIAGGFSPNQDGYNDKWIIVRPFGTTIEVKVFNRWGNIVYQNGNYMNDWDSRGQQNFAGDYVTEGTYFYLVTAVKPDGTKQNFNGSLTIVR